MERQNPLISALKTIGILPLYDPKIEREHLQELKKLEQLYTWKINELDMDLIYGYYYANGREAEQVIQTPFENFCIAKSGDRYDLFKIRQIYRPIHVSFQDYPEIKDWLEQRLGHIV